MRENVQFIVTTLKKKRKFPNQFSKKNLSEVLCSKLNELSKEDGEQLEEILGKLELSALNKLLEPLHFSENKNINKDWLFYCAFLLVLDQEYVEYAIKHLAPKLNRIPEDKLSISSINLLDAKTTSYFEDELKTEIQSIRLFIHQFRIKKNNVAVVQIDDENLLEYEVMSEKNKQWAINEIKTFNEERESDPFFYQTYGKSEEYPERVTGPMPFKTNTLNITLAEIEIILKKINIKSFSNIHFHHYKSFKPTIPISEGVFGWGYYHEAGIFVSLLDKKINHIWIDLNQITKSDILNEMTEALNLLGTEFNLILVNWISEEVIDLSNSVEVRNFLNI